MESRRNILYLLLILLIAVIACDKETPSILEEPIIGMEFVYIPKGRFQMGAVDSNDVPRLHQVILTKGFWMGKTEVTQGQWDQIMGAGEIHPEKPSPFRSLNPNYPVVSISYFDIENFLEKLNNLSSDYRFRLPTEAEWEYACRAGSTTAFSFGTKLNDSQANFNAQIPSEYADLGEFLEHPKAVGSYPPNQWGLYDLHGNAWEWVSDWYAPYPLGAIHDPKGPSYGNEKIIRGGSWFYGADNARSYHRRGHEPKLWGFSIGFRIVFEKK